MSRWTCPRCDREFGRANQSHVCVPAGALDDCFAGRPPVQRQIADLLIAHVRALGPVHEDTVGVGVFLKSDRKLAELRPHARALHVALLLGQTLDHPRLRVLRASSDRYANIVKLTTVDEVDDDVLAWLTQAYDEATD